MKILFEKFYVLLKWIRYKELFLLLSPPFMGVLLGEKSVSSLFSAKEFINFFLVMVAAYFGGAHVFLFNLWGGIKYNKLDAEWIDYPLQKEEVNENIILAISLIFLLISFFIYILLNIRMLIISAVIALLWILYAHPKTLLKGKSFFAILIHFINGNLHFLLGYIYRSDNFSTKSLLISNYFSLIFVAGYFHHILKDKETDKQMSIKTLATKYNPSIIFYIGNLIFLFTFLYLGFLCYFAILPEFFFIANIPIIVLLMIFFFRYLKKELNKQNIISYRKNIESFLAYMEFL